VIGREINTLQVFELKAGTSVDNNMLKACYLYRPLWECGLILKNNCRGCQLSVRDFDENQKNKPFYLVIQQ
jgi:hypothetical protein